MSALPRIHRTRPVRREPHGRRGVASVLWIRLVLGWFLLSLGAAIASPVVHPQAFELICSGTGTAKVVVQTDDGAREMGAAHLDCPLCLPAGAPPPLPAVALPPVLPLARAVQAVPAAVPGAAAALPPPARAPPNFL
jgi:hypothetical protein